MAFMYILRGIE